MKRSFLLTGEGWPYLLVPLIPVAILLELVHADPVPIFAASALGVIPTAALMGRATEELAARSGPGIGGLLNVTFGNAPELIIALFALGAGLHEVVKASVVGSILGNILLVMGVSMLAGGLRRDRQFFEARAASAQSLMLFLAAVALIMPAIFQLVSGGACLSPRARRGVFCRPEDAVRRRRSHLALLVRRRVAVLPQDPQGPVQSQSRRGRSRRGAVDGTSQRPHVGRRWGSQSA